MNKCFGDNWKCKVLHWSFDSRLNNVDLSDFKYIVLGNRSDSTSFYLQAGIQSFVWLDGKIYNNGESSIVLFQTMMGLFVLNGTDLWFAEDVSH